MDRLPALAGEHLALLADYFYKQPHVAAAFLFGLYGRGAARPDSDVDIAVLMEHDAPDDAMRPVMFTSELMRLLGREDINVVTLNSASPLLRHRVVRDGYVLFGTSNTVLAEFGMV
ncbi:MAG: nucleotidyltransferase domain-containing protein [Trueperaceae bacterium]|nr:nucleotidyltransferase domain-containing protein [Trueperaceae bacterium]